MVGAHEAAPASGAPALRASISAADVRGAALDSRGAFLVAEEVNPSAAARSAANAAASASAASTSSQGGGGGGGGHAPPAAANEVTVVEPRLRVGEFFEAVARCAELLYKGVVAMSLPRRVEAGVQHVCRRHHHHHAPIWGTAPRTHGTARVGPPRAPPTPIPAPSYETTADPGPRLGCRRAARHGASVALVSAPR